jgi:hypothetical protein
MAAEVEGTDEIVARTRAVESRSGGERRVGGNARRAKPNSTKLVSRYMKEKLSQRFGVKARLWAAQPFMCTQEDESANLRLMVNRDASETGLLLTGGHRASLRLLPELESLERLGEDFAKALLSARPTDRPFVPKETSEAIRERTSDLRKK